MKPAATHDSGIQIARGPVARRPAFHHPGLPMCSHMVCPQYSFNGTCADLGATPESLCLPQVREMAKSIGAVLEAFDQGDVEINHEDFNDGVCPEDDTCECRGPAAINRLAKAIKP